MNIKRINIKRIWDDSFYNQKLRLGLHVLFWFLFFMFGTAETMVFSSPIRTHWYVNFVGILLCLVIFYPLAYGIIPFLFRKKWLAAAGLFNPWYISSLLLLKYEVMLVIAWNNEGHIRLLGQELLENLMKMDTPMEWLRNFVSGLFSFLGIANIALIVKMFRYLYRINADLSASEKQKLVLGQENLQLELNALKSQVNPHFLFNTLNNIQSFILHNEKDKSIDLISRLSEMMRFAIYECQDPLVPLEKEIRMMNNYIELERIRCEDRAEITIRVEGKCEDASIPPLLLVTFVENALKHGVNTMTGRSWIQVKLEQGPGSTDLFVENNYDPAGPGHTHKGIGLDNARRRLQHYYPGKYSLQAGHIEDVFKVHLHIEQ